MAAGAPRRKNPRAIWPPSFSSLSLWLIPKSSAHAVKLGARRFWSANRKSSISPMSAMHHVLSSVGHFLQTNHTFCSESLISAHQRCSLSTHLDGRRCLLWEQLQKSADPCAGRAPRAGGAWMRGKGRMRVLKRVGRCEELHSGQLPTVCVLIWSTLSVRNISGPRGSRWAKRKEGMHQQ